MINALFFPLNTLRVMLEIQLILQLNAYKLT
jgi:hypothetical protein